MAGNRIHEESKLPVTQTRRLLPSSFAILILFLSGIALAPPAAAQKIDSSFYAGMRWRLVGPYRAGRVTTVAGIAGNPNIYYMGTPGGGVWETTDGGTVWRPIFDAEHVASIGALAVAGSNPKIIYVATGEQTQGNGVYKSTDGGKTWTHVGLADTHYINAIVIDPRNPEVVLAGAMWAPTPRSTKPSTAARLGAKFQAAACPQAAGEEPESPLPRAMAGAGSTRFWTKDSSARTTRALRGDGSPPIRA